MSNQMKIREFLNNEKIPHYNIWYYLNDAGKKMPIGAKNNDTLETILKKQKINNHSKPQHKSDGTPFKDDEFMSLKPTIMLFLNHTDNIYCIDVDEPHIRSMEDFIADTGCDLFKDACWVEGNTKGIHIYIKIDNMVKFTDKQNVFKNFKGDLMQVMWERGDKHITNYNNTIPLYHFDEISNIFNAKISNNQQKIKTVVEVKNPVDITVENKVEETKETPIYDIPEKFTEISNLIKCFSIERATDYTPWLEVMIMIANELGENGEQLFFEFSKKASNYNENECKRKYREYFYKSKKLIKEQKLTIASGHFWAKKDNNNLYLNLFKKDNKDESKKFLQSGKGKVYDREHKSVMGTDYTFAVQFCDMYKDEFVCTSIKKNEMYQFSKETKIWELLEEGNSIRNKISKEFATFYSDKLDNLTKINNPDRDTELEIGILTEALTKLGRHSDKVHIFNEIKDLSFDATFMKTINREKYVLPIQNGKMINLMTNEVYDRTIENKFSYECNAQFIDLTEDEEALMRKYFLDLFSQNEKIAQAFFDLIKSALSGITLRYILFATGDGANGKSLIFKVLGIILNSAMDTISKLVILESRNSSNINTEYEKLDKVRMGFISELKEEDTLNITNIKAITGGDALNLRTLHTKDKTVYPTCNLFVATNELPKFKMGKAIKDRLIVIPFKNTFQTNISFENELMDKKDALFSYIIKYGNIRDNFDDLPEEMLEAKNQYVEDNTSDILGDFITNKYKRVDYDPNNKKNTREKRDDFIYNFNEYCKVMGYKKDTRSDKKLTRDLKKYNVQSKESNGSTYYLGLKFRSCEELEEETEEEAEEISGI